MGVSGPPSRALRGPDPNPDVDVTKLLLPAPAWDAAADGPAPEVAAAEPLVDVGPLAAALPAVLPEELAATGALCPAPAPACCRGVLVVGAPLPAVPPAAPAADTDAVAVTELLETLCDPGGGTVEEFVPCPLDARVVDVARVDAESGKASLSAGSRHGSGAWCVSASAPAKRYAAW